MKGISPKKLVIISLLISLEIVLTRVFSIQTQIVRISFGFLPLAICAAIFGPIYGAIAAVIGSLLGVTIFSRGVFFPGFTLTAELTGTIYGIFLYRKPKNFKYVTIAVLLVSIVQLVLNTTWLYIMLDVGILAMLPSRIVSTVIMIPIQIFTILFFWNSVILKINLQYD